MDRERRFIQKWLPRSWFDRIDLEGRGIRQFMEKAASEIPKGSLVLDAGAGQTPYRGYFRSQRYFSIDFAKGESAWDYSGLDTVGNLQQLPFADGVFDAVISTQVLEHTSEPTALLEETYRVLKSGGRLYLTAPLGFGEHQQPYDFFRYTRYGLRYLLKKSGFTIEALSPRGGYFWYLAVMMMWIYIYLFPSGRSSAIRWLLAPLQILAAVVFLMILPPIISSLDFLDREKCITLGYSVIAEKPSSRR